jgi:hypothetical protein
MDGAETITGKSIPLSQLKQNVFLELAQDEIPKSDPGFLRKDFKTFEKNDREAVNKVYS